MELPIGRIAAGIAMVGLNLFISWVVIILAVGLVHHSSGSRVGLDWRSCCSPRGCHVPQGDI